MPTLSTYNTSKNKFQTFSVTIFILNSLQNPSFSTEILSNADNFSSC